ncbi:MAG: ATP-binding protein [Salinivirgaceae bacterium]|jgi:signal transduction histidine kinase/CheY-like chemotaxis protein|nr:ATP-binding protein [Salinivirgaceae bacterium]
MEEIKNYPESENKTKEEIHFIKEKLIEFLYWIFTIFMWFALAGSLFRTLDLGFQTLNYVQIIMVIIFLVVFFVRKKISCNTKSFILLATAYLLGATAIYSLGLFSQGMYFLLLFSILSGILINKIWGLAAFGLSFLSLIILAWLFINQIIPQNEHISNYSITLSAWTMAILMFSLVTWVIIVFWERIFSFLVLKVDVTLKHEYSLNKVNKLLSKEIESRKTAELLLRTQNKETKHLNTEYENINKQLQDTIAELEKSNILLAESKLKAQKADKLKTSFLTNMSHEIRTPMNAIVGFATLMAQNDLSAKENKNYLDIIQSSTHSLLNTITNILTLAKIESGQFTVYPQKINLNEFIDELQERFIREVLIQKDNNVELIFVNKFPSSTQIISDIESLNQIACKLIGNAIKFTQKGYIKIITSLNENYILKLTIEDSGIGIPADLKKHIFEIFTQVDHGNNRKYEGIGIGLSIAKGLVNLLNGTIDFHSEPNKGSVFSIAIPVINKTQNNETKHDKIEVNGKGKTVLVIGKITWDDREINNILQEINSILIYIETGIQAIDIHKEHPEIDLVIISEFLPDMNSHEVAKLLKSSYLNLPIIAHLSTSKTEMSYAIQENNWDYLIEAPFNKRNFLNVLKKFFS